MHPQPVPDPMRDQADQKAIIGNPLRRSADSVKMSSIYVPQRRAFTREVHRPSQALALYGNSRRTENTDGAAISATIIFSATCKVQCILLFRIELQNCSWLGGDQDLRQPQRIASPH